MAAKKSDFTVDKILNCRRKINNQFEFLIRWKGFSKSYDTWEPKANLGSCEKVLDNYMTTDKFKRVKETAYEVIKITEKIKPALIWTKFKSKNDRMKKKSTGTKQKKPTKNLPIKKKATVAHAKRTVAKYSKLKPKNQQNLNIDKKKVKLLKKKSSEKGVRYMMAQTKHVAPPVLKKHSSQSKVRESIEHNTIGRRTSPRKSNSAFVGYEKVINGRSVNFASIDDPDISFSSVVSSRVASPMFNTPQKFPQHLGGLVRPEPMMPTILPTSQSATHIESHQISPSRKTRSASSTPTLFRPVSPINSLPGNIPLIAGVIPNSPASLNYQALVANLPPNKRKAKYASDQEVLNERRLSIRQGEGSFRYKDIIVKKYSNYTQIWFASNTPVKNALNPQVFGELISAFNNARYDNSNVVMLSGSGSIFCSGIDLDYFLNCSRSTDKKDPIELMVESLMSFVKLLISYPKPIVAAVNGPAVGLGLTILPLCDIVYASDKATFHCPYTILGQTPEGAASYTLPQHIGLPMANEMLLCGRRLTAIEAYQVGLVSQVFWPTSMMQEVIPRVQYMAAQSSMALETSKLLIRSQYNSKLDAVLQTECRLLSEYWKTSDFRKSIRAYLDMEQEYFY